MNRLRYTNAVLTVLALLLSLNLWVELSGPGSAALPGVQTAHAQGVGGGGAREVEMIRQLENLNAATKAIQAQLVGGISVDVKSMPAGGDCSPRCFENAPAAAA